MNYQVPKEKRTPRTPEELRSLLDEYGLDALEFVLDPFGIKTMLMDGLKLLEDKSPEDHRTEVMELAHTIDVGCWVSYSGKSKAFKRFIERRRQAAIDEARKQIEEGS